MAEENQEGFITITVPAALGEKIQGRIAGTGFSSVSEYVTFVLREVVSEDDDSGEEALHFSKEDEESVKVRLRALGYID